MAASKTMGTIRIGVGGWTYQPWRGLFYPSGLAQKRELEYASRQLATIEINGTYYGTQKPASFAKWHDETPDNFVFSVKAPRYAMNRKVLAEAGTSITRFFASGVTELKNKLGPINWQFLPTKKFEPADFESFLKLLPREAAGRELRHVIEVRHESFRTPDFIALIREYGVGIVVAGDSAYPQIADVTAPFIYARLMGTTPDEQSGYSGAAQKVWIQRARAWASGATPEGLKCVEAPFPDGKLRDVFLYVISGHKALNPAAAVSLIRAL